jgi:hypothetical protein
MTTNALIKPEAVQNLQALSNSITTDIRNAEEGLMKSAVMGNALVRLSEAMEHPDLTNLLIYLQDTDVGFLTDRKPRKPGDKGYPIEVVRGIAVRAILHGAHLHGNEFNIIAGSCYLTVNFYRRSIAEHPGVTDLDIQTFVPDEEPRKVGSNLFYRFGGYARCKVDGRLVEVRAEKSDEGDSRMIVKAYDNDTAYDGAEGKALKRLAKRLYLRIKGVELSDEDSDDDMEPLNVKTPSQRRQERQQAVDEDQFRSHWGNELRTKDETAKEAATRIFDIYRNRDEAALTEFLDGLKESPIQQRFKDLLEHFANAVRERWQLTEAA